MKIKTISVIILLSLVGCEKSQSLDQSNSAEAPNKLSIEQTEEEALQQSINKALLDEVKGRLKDDEAAKFKDVIFYRNHGARKDGSGSIEMSTVCGKVNSKNSFGAYNGYIDFFATISRKLPDDVYQPERIMVAFDDIGNDDNGKREFLNAASLLCTNKDIE
jgi:ABC-type phosphate/phosphonate transport system substrate-binding protein